MVYRKGKQAINCYSISRSETTVVKRYCPHMLLELGFFFFADVSVLCGFIFVCKNN